MRNVRSTSKRYYRSDPSSPNYGKYYSEESIHDIFAPSSKSVHAVRTWLIESGIEESRIKHSTNKQWLEFSATSGELESLLQTRYSVPISVKDHIDYITPGVKHLITKKRSIPTSNMGIHKRGFNMQHFEPPINVETNTSLCSEVTTPACIRGHRATKNNELGIVAQLDAYSQEDLDEYLKIVSPKTSGARPNIKSIDGGVAPVPPEKAGPESNLDVMSALPLIWPQNLTVYQVDDPVYQEGYDVPGFLNNFLDALDKDYCDDHSSNLDPSYPHRTAGGYNGTKQCGVHKSTNVLAISYASGEENLPQSYQIRQCYEWLKLGLRGITVVAASGDWGVQSDKESKDGCPNDSFAPVFPASCPYVTAVGGTGLPSGAKAEPGNEIASTQFPSGGGFSNTFPRPSWQNSAVLNYFDKHDPGYEYYLSTGNVSLDSVSGMYNRIGRAYPDISALSQKLPIILNGKPSMQMGTSGATPYIASIINMINEERLAKGMPTVGFINPILYAHPEVFNDVKQGDNAGCNTTGFHAVEGWDPVTGLGTPDYQKLLKIFMK
ncbi:hypothetical protein KEM55_001732 [Ascosphaera atra]|nr:hypothetical protein KEM55_001732 [Ascosphaera atra]